MLGSLIVKLTVAAPCGFFRKNSHQIKNATPAYLVVFVIAFWSSSEFAFSAFPQVFSFSQKFGNIHISRNFEHDSPKLILSARDAVGDR